MLRTQILDTSKQPLSPLVHVPAHSLATPNTSLTLRHISGFVLPKLMIIRYQPMDGALLVWLE